MYAAHFGLREPPFAITPDPAYVYLSRHHREALAHLLYGTGENGGFVQLTGEVGTGKTTLVRTLLEQRLENVDIALCLNPRLTVVELLATVCDELGVAYPREYPTLKPLLDALNAHLLRTHAAGRRTVLIIDEAQNLSREVLEQVRLLTNLETAKHKLLRIILVGQPELRQLLARPDLRQLAQRITARYHLPPLEPRETAAYIRYRLQVAGGREELFSDGALRAVHQRSGGIPRLINIICDRALLGAYGQNARRVDAGLVCQAAREALQGGPGSPAAPRGWRALGVGLAGLAMIGAVWWLAANTDLLSRSTEFIAGGPAAIIPVQHVNPAGPPVSPTTPATPAAPTAKVPAPPAPPTATPDLRTLLRQAAGDNANDRLLAVWGIAQPPPGRAPFCEQVKAHGLRCLAGRGDWDALRRFDRPTVLRLTQPGGVPTPTLLRALAGDQATLEVAGQAVTVPLAQLAPLWTGHYLLLWRPQVDQRVIGPGNTGEAVLWLRRRLALAAGQPAPEPLSATFDATLAEQLRAFQRERGLRPDGLAGERTLVLLSNLAPSPGTPVLGQPLQEP